MNEITKDQLAEVLAEHGKWVADRSTGKRADLSGADLSYYAQIYEDKARGYILYVIEAKQTTFVAGCRTFNYTDAITHWSEKSIQSEYVKAIKAYMLSKQPKESEQSP